MKTPDEIKKGLQYCFMEEHSDCSGCPYDDSEDHELKCLDEIQKDAFAYIQQLEVATEFYSNTTQMLDAKIAKLESRLSQVERERDALMYDYPIGIECHTCKHETTDCYEFPCNDCVEASRNAHHLMWEWRGVCEENTKDGADA